MTLLRKLRNRPAATRRAPAVVGRDLDRAMRLAPTRASREKLVLLHNR